MNWGYLLRGLIAGAGVTAYILSKKTRKAERPLKSLFRLTEGGFVGPSDFEDEVLWADVVRIQASKMDLASIDQIMLWIESEYDEYDINEDDPRWKQFVAAMEANLPVNEHWYEQVAQPPFAPSRTLVFEREAAPDTA